MKASGLVLLAAILAVVPIFIKTAIHQTRLFVSNASVMRAKLDLMKNRAWLSFC